jgi:hypothetical protein
MAMRKCGFAFVKKLVPNLKTNDIIDADVLAKREDTKGQREGDLRGGYHRQAAIVLKTLESFMNSADEERIYSSWAFNLLLSLLFGN